ncbi:hypothetical protein PG985_011720 [Apiospora marii]
MVTSAEIPSQFTSRWVANTGHPVLRAPSVQGRSGDGNSRSPQPRYNSSCNHCRQARIKCSGGTPCNRCANLPGTSPCVYKISQRHGKRKAIDIAPINPPPPPPPMAAGSRSSLQDLQRNVSVDLQGPLQSGSSQEIYKFNGHPFTVPPAISLDDFTFDDTSFLAEGCPRASAEFLNMFPTPISPLSNPVYDLNSTTSNENGPDLAMTTTTTTTSSSNDRHNSSSSSSLHVTDCTCHLENQRLLDRQDQITRGPEKASLDHMLVLMQELSGQLIKYRDCTYCNTKGGEGGGFRHLINMAMLQQSQVTLLCAVAKSPATFFGGGGGGGGGGKHTYDVRSDKNSDHEHPPRFTLGVYQLAPEDDLEHKRLVTLSMARQVEARVACFDDLVRGHQEVGVAGGAEAADTPAELVSINLQWLFNIARHLREQLKTAKSTLERPNWASAL